MEKKRVDVAYNLLGMVFFALLLGMAGMFVYNVLHDIITKH